MKTMIWKELRENARWAALAGFCLLLAEVFTLSSQRERLGNIGEGVTLCSSAFLLVSAFGCAVSGAALGALQILPELRRDQWASLLHRPVPRHVIFLGKVAAGLVLYFLATGLPLLVSIAYVARPGHFAAPFVPGLAAPAASDLLLGSVFYFTAVLLGLHQGRWWGSRGAIALSSVAVLVLHLKGSWPWALPVFAAATLFVAAWGAMSGAIALRSWLNRLAFGLVMLIGIQTALVLVGAAMGELPKNAIQTYLSYFYTNFEIANDGTVLLTKVNDQEGYHLVDMQGNIVTDERYVGNNSGQSWLSPYPLADRDFAGARRYVMGSRSSHPYVELDAGEYGGPELWYHIVGLHSYFVGYDKFSARCVGICDAEGFKGPDAVPHPFALEPQVDVIHSLPVIFWSGSRVFSVDFANRQMTALLDVGHDTIYGAADFPNSSAEHRIAVALSTEIRFLDPSGRPLFSVPYGYDAHLWPNVAITAMEGFGRTFLQYTPAFIALPGGERTAHLDVIDEHGQRIGAYTAPKNRRAVPVSWRTRVAGTLHLPAPALLVAMWTRAHPLNAVSDSSAAWTLMELMPAIDRAHLAGELGTLFGLAVVLAALAGVWGRRSGLLTGRTVMWVLLTLTFGVAGFLAYRVATDWPARVRCPRCAHKRPVSGVACPHCHEAWDALPANGSEIFEPA